MAFNPYDDPTPAEVAREFPARARRATRGALKSAPGISATSRLSVTRDLGSRIVADEHWPGMYRLRLSNGSLTDMTNLTRARDALANHGALNK